MYLQEISNYRPQKEAFFINGEHPRVAAHQSLDYLAFSTRENELVLRNMRTGRSAVVYKSNHPITQLLFTHEYLLAVEVTGHEIMAFSLKTGRLKKRLSGHTTQVYGLAYCRQKGMIGSLSHDLCIIFAEGTFSKEKTLKCLTSSFADCAFSLTGNVFVTVFADSSVILWNPEDFQRRESALAPRNLRVSLDHGSRMVVYNKQNVLLSNIAERVVAYQQIPKFWTGSVHQVTFLDGMLAINTDKAFYLAELYFDHQFQIGAIKEVQGQVNLFTTAGYQSQLVLIGQKLKKVSITKVRADSKQTLTAQLSPLTNEGLVCAGYTNSEGYLVTNGMTTGNNYNTDALQLESLGATNYQNVPTKFTLPKLKEFIRKNHALPDKHRPLAYRYLLKLPISTRSFRELQAKGRHPCAALLDARYPLQNLKLAEAMKDVVSFLAHYHPIFAEHEGLPTIIFPFVCLFGNDHFLCFQVLYRLFTGPLAFLFEEFPLANSKYLQNMFEILAKEDPELLNHLRAQGAFTKAAWGLLSSLFTTNLPREGFLAIIDAILVHYSEPEYIMFLCLGYLIYNRPRILSAFTQAQLESYFEQQHTVHLGKYLNIVDKLYVKHKKEVHYEFKTAPLSANEYVVLDNVPKDTLKMYQNKRMVMTEELLKRKQEEIYRDAMLKQMEKMTLQAKRDSERQEISKESYQLHCVTQNKNRLKMPQRDQSHRLERLQDLMNELTVALQRQKYSKEKMNLYVPSHDNLQNKSDEELNRLEQRMMEALSELKPNNFSHPLASQPVPPQHQGPKQQRAFKASVNAKLTSKLWELDEISQENQKRKWQNNMLASLNQ